MIGKVFQKLPLWAAMVFLAIALVYPLATLAAASLELGSGSFGIDNFVAFFQTPSLFKIFSNSLVLGAVVTAVTTGLAFFPSYAAARTRAFSRGAIYVLCLLPLFAPSFFPSLGLIILLGPQGPWGGLIPGGLIGPWGIVMGEVIYTLPHAVIILTACLRDIDPKLYAAARSLGAGPWRCLLTITLPAAFHGFISSAMVVFLLTITDFGVPKVLGGSYSVLATEVYKQVIGQHNLSMGATISLVMLLPALAAFGMDYLARKRRRHGWAAWAEPAIARKQDLFFTLAGWAVAALPLAVMATAVWSSFISFWPYDLTFTMLNYSFNDSIYGLSPIFNSLKLAMAVSLCGTCLIFTSAYVLERQTVPRLISRAYRLLAIMPMCIPGAALGLAYILAFNHLDGLPDWFYGSMLILVLNSIVHFYSLPHLTSSASLSGLDPNYENVGRTLGRPIWTTFLKVVLPMRIATVLEAAFYLFVSAMTTVSAVVFIYTPDMIPASVASLQASDAGQVAEAAAMGTLIMAASLILRCLIKIWRNIFLPEYENR
ncbi:putative 2-aminoethylphosphonate ABC transporter permease subunit [Deltaproteobacteria bacterium Smac51]|nr:putative 2-aminoethylphosphonate ABC transporter permease subunit [Deltaproteobacteria bacterium Smac51]